MAEVQYGFGRVIVAVYGVFAISSTARSLYQLFTKFDEAPVAYLLSAFAGLVYVLATWALATGRIRVARWAIGTELVGVLTVGLISVLHDEWLSDQSVWSQFGSGYGYIPLVLPLVGLWWLWKNRHEDRRVTGF